MSEALQIGLGNTVDRETVVFHGGITSRDSFGRITDLVVVWMRKEHELSQKLSGDLRVLIQGLLEFGFPKSKSTNGHLELAIENDQVYVGLRFNNFIVDEGDDVEKKLAKYWLNSDESSLIKKLLYSQDRVEVRFLKKANLLEWRIIRSISDKQVNLDLPSFQVFSDVEESFKTEHEQFVEMGDIPYEEWVAEVYKNKHEKNKSGEFFQNGESVQNEDEWARVAFERDKKAIDDSVKVFAAQVVGGDNDGATIEGGDPSNGSKLAVSESLNVGTNEIAVLNEKIRQYEKMLKQKEKQHQKTAMEVIALQERVNSVIKMAQAGDTKQVQLFRDKAMQMFEMVKILKLEKQQLEKTIFDLKRGVLPGGQGKIGDESPGMMLQIEELTKKAERFSRALEAEKQKVKMLSERAVSAEKEAQGASPLVDDLERKVEASIKMAQQHKKETEIVKQKLVQSDAEKNKIKNDLLKAQAQIQTLMKRQAA